MNQALSATRKQKILRETKDYLMIALGMVMYGIGWTAFLLPSDIPSGAINPCNPRNPCLFYI